MNCLLLLFPLIYFPSLFNFFSSDDWFLMRISQIGSLKEFLNFFSFNQTAQSAAFYRPLPQQLFLFIFQKLFGLNSLPYHLFVLFCFGLILYLLVKLAKKLNFGPKQTFFALLIYGFASANFPQVYFLSAFQDVLLPLFTLLTLISFLDERYTYSILFFVLALMSKETAVAIPGLLILINLLIRNKKYLRILPYIFLSIVYIYLRLKVFGNTQGDSYVWDFSPTKAANTFMWYSLWTVGAPEILVDYVGSGLKILPRFFTDLPLWSYIILIGLFATLTSFFLYLLSVKKSLSENFRFILFCVLFFITALIPVLFIPWHKFTHALSVPLIGFALFVGFFSKYSKLAVKIFITVFMITNLVTMILLYQKHYSVTRGRIAKKVYEFINTNYPVYPKGKYFFFSNTKDAQQTVWGESKQVAISLSVSDFFQVYYHDKNIKAYYQDIPESTPSGLQKIDIPSKQFLINQ